MTHLHLQPRASKKSTSSSQEKLRLLLVEDDDIDQIQVERMLKESSLNVQLVIANNLVQARSRLDTDEFDCVLLDLGLPDGDGLFLANEHNAPPTIILTGHDDEHLATQAMRQGAQDYLIKGDFNKRQLQRSILYAMERDRLRRELQRVTGELHIVVQTLEDTNEYLARIATVDALTGLHNRRAFDLRLEQLVKEASRGRQFCMVLLDVDHFKHFNDTYGHQMGDKVLAELGAYLKNNVREVDYPVRYGGEEFAILLVDISWQDAIALAEGLRLGMAHKLDLPHPVTASFGVQAFGAGINTGEELLRATDQALYRAKAAGRDRVEPAPVGLLKTPRVLCDEEV